MIQLTPRYGFDYPEPDMNEAGMPPIEALQFDVVIGAVNATDTDFTTITITDRNAEPWAMNSRGFGGIDAAVDYLREQLTELAGAAPKVKYDDDEGNVETIEGPNEQLGIDARKARLAIRDQMFREEFGAVTTRNAEGVAVAGGDYDADGNPLFDEELEAALDAAEGVLARTDVLVEARHWEVVGR